MCHIHRKTKLNNSFYRSLDEVIVVLEVSVESVLSIKRGCVIENPSKKSLIFKLPPPYRSTSKIVGAFPSDEYT